ncbi:MAG: hypothetical protein DRO67_05485 [Candidatus Asgardarchaeum californiense]|nr:MAG: hypothetical protein DRO67_05485 [Candidatus Asgardarchaeum californiense]
MVELEKLEQQERSLIAETEVLNIKLEKLKAKKRSIEALEIRIQKLLALKNELERCISELGESK